VRNSPVDQKRVQLSGAVTEAETVEEAFDNARDAAKALRRSRAKLLRKLSKSAASA
jgi:hypothetical protein